MKKVINNNRLPKQDYKKPFIKVALVAYETSLLQESQTPPSEIPDYDDWLGARQHNGVWDEDDWEEK